MNRKEKKDLSRKTRRRRRSLDKTEIEASSLETVSTPVDTVPDQKKSNPKNAIQEKILLPAQENIVTAAAASTSERVVYNNLHKSSRDSGISNLDYQLVHCQQQQQQQQQRNSRRLIMIDSKVGDAEANAQNIILH